MSMFTVTVSAKDIHFYLTKGEKDTEVNTKDRTQNTWLITVDQPTGQSIYNFVECQTVVGFRIRSSAAGGAGTSMSDYVTISRFVTNKAYSYTTVPSQGASIYLHCQINSSSKLPYVSFDGKWYS